MKEKTTEQHIAVLAKIINGIGTMSMEYWTDRTAEEAQAALDHLSSIARQAQYLRAKIGAEDEDALVVAVQKAFGCGEEYQP